MIIEALGISGIGKSTTMKRVLNDPVLSRKVKFIKSLPIKIINKHGTNNSIVQDEILRYFDGFYGTLDNSTHIYVDDGIIGSLIYQNPHNIDKVKDLLLKHRDNMFVVWFTKDKPYDEALKESYRQWLNEEIIEKLVLKSQIAYRWLLDNEFLTDIYINDDDLTRVLKQVLHGL